MARTILSQESADIWYKYNTVFHDCHIAPTDFSTPAQKLRPSFPRQSLLTPGVVAKLSQDDVNHTSVNVFK